MENETKTTKKELSYYIKKYGYYFALAGLLIVLSVAIVLTSVMSNNEEETEQTNSAVISFGLPVLNGTVIKNYSDTQLQYNSVLNIWEIHKAVDFAAEVGTDVLACYDGVVSSIETNFLEGTVIEIDHGDGLKTCYGSLDGNVNVKVGDIVNKGDILGKASNTATGEVETSGEVHFEVWKDGNLVDPSAYMDISTGK